MSTLLITVIVVLAFVAANLPWLSDKVLGLVAIAKYSPKPVWIRLIEWLILYFVLGGIALGFESKLNGQIHPQDWEFYTITLCIFFVLSVPGFIYHYEFKREA